MWQCEMYRLKKHPRCLNHSRVSSITDESRSPRAAPSERNTPEKSKFSKTKRPPPRERTTPEKTKEDIQSKIKASTNTGKNKGPKRTYSDDDEDFISTEENMDSETRGTSKGQRLRSPKMSGKLKQQGQIDSQDEQASDEEDNRSRAQKTNGKEKEQENIDSQEDNETDEAKKHSPPPKKKAR